MSDGAPLPPVRRIRNGTMFAYGFGAIAYGVKDSSFGTFLLLFYNQVIGLPAAAVGLAIMCALLVDAFIDPAIGVFSDRTRGRWGRRHPWMYSAALPIAAGWLLLWNPPGWHEGALLVWLFATAVAVRTAVSAYEVPSVALTAELSADYDERTRIMAYRYLFGWAGGLGMLALTYWVFLVPDATHSDGLLNRDGYRTFALVGALVMFTAILTSALGTHREIKRLPRPTDHAPGLGAAFRELVAAANNRAFATLMLGGLFFYTNQGMSFALSNYLYSHVWGFQTLDYVMLTGVLLIGATLAFALAPRLARRIGKPTAAALAVAGSTTLMIVPYLLRLAGLFPAADAPSMPWVLFAIYVLNTACGVSGAMLASSMMADVVEHSEMRTGRRSEGVFFAGSFFVQKCTSGVGIFVASAILSLAAFPESAPQGSVPVHTVDRLTILFACVYAVLGYAAAWIYGRFPFGRAEHLARVEALASAEAAAP